MVIKVLGKTCSFRLLEKRLSELWTEGDKLDIIDLEGGFYAVRFYRKEHYDTAIQGGPWLIQGHYIAVKKWKPMFSPAKEEISHILAWVRLPQIPLEYFHERAILTVGNVLGKAVRVDMTTLKTQRGKYARVCVEIDFNKPLMSEVVVDGNTFAVEYEGLNQICFKCGRYGHTMDECPEGREGNVNLEAEIPSNNSGVSRNEPFGPWMIASNTRRRRQDMDKKRGEDMETKNVPTVKKGKQKASGGSRFVILEDEEELPVEELEEEDDDLQYIAGVPDNGPKAFFNVTSRENIRAKKKKGIHVKNTNRNLTMPKEPVRNTSKSIGDVISEALEGMSTRGGSYRGRGRSLRGGGRGSNGRSLQDITNRASTSKSRLDSCITNMDWPPLGSANQKFQPQKFEFQIKQHPPDEMEGVHNEVDNPTAPTTAGYHATEDGTMEDGNEMISSERGEIPMRD